MDFSVKAFLFLFFYAFSAVTRPASASVKATLTAASSVTSSSSLSPSTTGAHDHHSMGGRSGFHGMVLYGAGPYFIDHIPMLMPPHDMQMIAEVSLSGGHGEKITMDFSHEGFTVEPAGKFPLDELVAGHLTSFQGKIHRGGFEQGGPVIVDAVTVSIVQVKLARALPAESVGASVGLPGGLSGDPSIVIGGEFVVNIITPSSNKQEIKNKFTGETLWCVKGPDFGDPCD